MDENSISCAGKYQVAPLPLTLSEPHRKARAQGVGGTASSSSGFKSNSNGESAMPFVKDFDEESYSSSWYPILMILELIWGN